MSPDPLPNRSSTVTTELLVRDVILGDGSSLRLVAPGPEDYEDVKAFYDRLSPESRYMRFHGMVRTEFPARHVVEAGGVDRFALICRHDGRVVAVASYDRLREPGAAEVSFAVADEFRRRWTATRLEPRRSPRSGGSAGFTRRCWPITPRRWASFRAPGSRFGAKALGAR